MSPQGCQPQQISGISARQACCIGQSLDICSWQLPQAELLHEKHPQRGVFWFPAIHFIQASTSFSLSFAMPAHIQAYGGTFWLHLPWALCMQPPRLSQIHHAQGCPAPYAQHGIAMHRAVQPNFDQTQGCPAQVLSDTRLSSLKVTASSPKVWYGGQHKHPTHRQASFVPFCRIVTSKVLYLWFKPSLPISFSMPSKIYSSEALQPSRLAGPVTSHCHTQLWQGMTSSVNSPAWLGIPGSLAGKEVCGHATSWGCPAQLILRQSRRKGLSSPKQRKGLSSPWLVTGNTCMSKRKRMQLLLAEANAIQKSPCLGWHVAQLQAWAV